MRSVLACVCLIAAVTALPYPDQVISRMGEEERYQYLQAEDGTVHLVDTWLKMSDLKQAARYAPDMDNVYHLFTRDNQFVSNPLTLGSNALLAASNYNSARRTVVIIHGWQGSAAGELSRQMVPAYLAAEDVNLIAVDWSVGAAELIYPITVQNVINSGESAARFFNWLNIVTGTTPEQYHIVGFSLGGQQAGIIGRHIAGNVAYLTSLDPAAPGFLNNTYTLRATDATYTEVIHTRAGVLSYIDPIGHVDFYPNGGVDQPGCVGFSCSHDRAFEFMAESVWSGGFTGIKCEDYQQAMREECEGEETLQMGGIHPKTGSTGVYHLKTTATPPYSLG